MMQVITLILPYPTFTGNNRNEGAYQWTHNTPAYAKWRGDVAMIARAHMGFEQLDMLTGDVEADFMFFRRAARSDGDNLIKVTQDALNGIVYKDDSQIKRGVFEIFDEYIGEPRIVVSVWERKQHGQNIEASEIRRSDSV